ncbi:MAG: DUF1405 domain-containing protein [Paenibacillaceae bacterium]
MNPTAQLAFFWSKAFLTSRRMLWIIFWVNFLGTIYGYEWYWNQMQETVADKPLWLVIFVPDSPTASLFFTLTLVYLLIDSYIEPTIHNSSKAADFIRGIVEALAVMASFKYGVWAVAIILLAAFKGEPMNWQDWMLSISHGGMAIEALLFMRFFRVNLLGLGIAALWIFGNDYIDYHYAVFPWLPDVLYAILESVRNATIALSIITCIIFIGLYKLYSHNRV